MRKQIDGASERVRSTFLALLMVPSGLFTYTQSYTLHFEKGEQTDKTKQEVTQHDKRRPDSDSGTLSTNMNPELN